MKWLLALGFCALTTLSAAEPAKLKAGFIYVGPVGDFGWSYSHDAGRKLAEKECPWLETIMVESVPEADFQSYAEQMIKQGAKVICATSFGYLDGMMATAKAHPDVLFLHCTGTQRAANVATYNVEPFEGFYLNGLVAGALTKTGQAGAVGGYPIPLIKRALNAFTLGLREVNPKAELKVRWLNSWYAPAAAREASEALIGAGCDLLITTEGSPTAIQVAGEHKLPTFSEGMDMLRFAPDYVASGQLSNWGSIYVDFFKRVHSGEYTAKNLQSVDYFWGLPEGGIEMAAKPGLPLNPRYVEPLKAFKIQHTEFGAISAYDLLQKRLAQLSAKPPAFSSLTGPLKDRKGVLRLEPGKRVTREQLDSMEWCAPGLTGPWPSEP